MVTYKSRFVIPVMTDGLSIAASIVAVLGVAVGVVRTLSTINRICDAPQELLALINEVSDLQIILCDVQNYVQSSNGSQTSREYLHHLSNLVHRSETKLKELEGLIDSKVLEPRSLSNATKLSKREWLKAIRKIHRFQRSLRDIHLAIVTQMVMINS